MVVFRAGRADYWNEFENEIFSHTGSCIVTMLSMCAAGVYVSGMNRVYLEQQKREQYRSQVAFYKMLEDQYGQMERLRHDMKNHLTGLMGLWEDREWEKMGLYLARMLEAGGLGQGEEATGSNVLDALLYRKRRQAEAEKISWDCDVQIPGDCLVDEFDLCVLMGNLVDNALEGCGRIARSVENADGDTDRYIRIRSGAVKKCFLLEVENSAEKGADAPAALRNAGKFRHSTKENPEEHGIGLLNVRETVEKYGGVMNAQVRDGAVVVSVLLPATHK